MVFDPNKMIGNTPKLGLVLSMYVSKPDLGKLVLEAMVVVAT